jgi:hypothetical protein
MKTQRSKPAVASVVGTASRLAGFLLPGPTHGGRGPGGFSPETSVPIFAANLQVLYAAAVERYQPFHGIFSPFIGTPSVFTRMVCVPAGWI